MGNIKINLWVIAAIIAIFGIVYFTVQAVQEQTYTGSEITFNSTGVIDIQNPSDDAVLVTATSRRAFNVTTNHPDVRTMRPTREGSGSAARYIAAAELPASQVELNVTRGTDVDFVITTAENANLNVVVAARTAKANRDLVLMSIVGVAALLIFISFQTEHYALRYVRNQFRSPDKRGDVGSSPA